MAQLTPEDRARLDAFKAVTVKHAHLTRVDDQLSLWVEEHTDATHVLLCGPGGVGKSKALTVVAERFLREELDRFVIPILLLEPIPPDLGPNLAWVSLPPNVILLENQLLPVRKTIGCSFTD